MTVTAYYPEVYVNDLEGALEEFNKSDLNIWRQLRMT